jgi:hypothetical protein
MARTVRCPICKTEVPLDSPEMPFCSDRCRIIDLGNWASEKYTIPSSGRSDEMEELEDRPPGALGDTEGPVQ